MRRCRSSRCRHFYPRPPRGGRRSSSKGNGKACKFLSTPSARRATVRQSRLSGSHQISIHALREEGDKDTEGQKQQMNIFLSTPSARRATGREQTPRREHDNFYPRPPRGGRPKLQTYTMICWKISIHALREEGDPKSFRGWGWNRYDFYPRPPRGGRPVGALWMA